MGTIAQSVICVIRFFTGGNKDLHSKIGSIYPAKSPPDFSGNAGFRDSVLVKCKNTAAKFCPRIQKIEA